MKLEALIIGNEILTGRRRDAHFTTTIAACEARGLRLSGAHFLADDSAVLVDFYRRARADGVAVLSFGGIGATPDDKTRQAVAAAAGVPLEYHPDGDALLQEKFGAKYDDLRRELIHFPSGARLIPNPINGVPGFSCGDIHCVPGFPEMAAPMAAWVLDEYYLPHAQKRDYRALTVFAPESQLAPIMAALTAEHPAVSISSLPKLHHETELGFDGAPAAIALALAEAEKMLTAAGIYFQA